MELGGGNEPPDITLPGIPVLRSQMSDSIQAEVDLALSCFTELFNQIQRDNYEMKKRILELEKGLRDA